jgi:hypothetical protein
MSPIISSCIGFVVLMVIWFMYLTRDNAFNPAVHGWHICHVLVSFVGTLALGLLLMVVPMSTRIEYFEIEDIIRGKSHTSIKLMNGKIINDTRVTIYKADSITVEQRLDMNSLGVEYVFGGYVVKVKGE